MGFVCYAKNETVPFPFCSQRFGGLGMNVKCRNKQGVLQRNGNCGENYLMPSPLARISFIFPDLRASCHLRVSSILSLLGIAVAPLTLRAKVL